MIHVLVIRKLSDPCFSNPVIHVLVHAVFFVETIDVFSVDKKFEYFSEKPFQEKLKYAKNLQTFLRT